VVFTSGAYFAYLFHILLGLPLIIAVALSVASCAVLGSLIEMYIYRPLRKTKASAMALLLSSLGIYIVLQNMISMMFGDDTKSIRTGDVVEGLNVFGARITPIQILIICSGMVLVVMVAVFLKKSKTGKAMRAVANDPELADISGVESSGIILRTFLMGSALAGVAGILVSLDVDMTPTMGMNALMMGVVAMIVGGAGSIPGVALGALLLALAQNFGVWKISSQWQDTIAFVILLVFLLFRPEGFFGRKVKKASI
jgi:branched-chain amino acid transport system permease protein